MTPAKASTISARPSKPKSTAKKTRTTAVKAANDRIAGIGSDAVHAKTGRHWDQWLAVLDKAKASTWTHKEIAQWLYDEQKVSGWWSQMITVGYEQARGLRAAHETPSGWNANASKTIAVPLAELYAAWSDARKRARWLGKKALTIRTATPKKSLRITWDDDTRLEVNFLAKGARKSLVAVQHSKLTGANAVAKSKVLWTRALEKLKTQLEGAG